MGYQAGGTNYNLGLRQQALDKTTGSLKAEGQRARQNRIKESGKRSGLSKLVSAGVRGAAAYFSGGASEAMGFGGMIDSAMLGTDSEGNAVRNEYGELVGAASQIGSAMSSKKAGEAAQKLKMQQTADSAMQDRLDKLDPRLGMDYALKLQEKDKTNLAALQGHESGFMGLMNKDVDGLDLEATTVGDWQSSIKGAPKVTTPDGSDGNERTTDFRREGAGETFMPESPSSSTKGKTKSSPVSIIDDREKEKKRQRAELKAIGKPPTKDERKQTQAIRSWTSGNYTDPKQVKNKYKLGGYKETTKSF